MPQPRPDGIEWEITDEWLEWLDKRMEATGLSQRGLADRIVAAGGQATGASISDIQTRKVPRSRLVPAINAVLGGPVPTQRILAYERAVDETRARIDEKLALLDDQGQHVVLQMLEQMTKDR